MTGIIKISYERAKQSAKENQKNGRIAAYINDLLIMDYYKQIIANS